MSGYIREARLHIQSILTRDFNGTPLTYTSLKPFISTGDRKGVPISFSVSKVCASTSNESTIVLGNLSPDKRDSIMRMVEQTEKWTTASLFCGYVGDIALLSGGKITKALPEKDGVNNIMTLTFVDSIPSVMLGAVSKSYPAGASVKSIVMDLAKMLQGVIVDEGRIQIDGEIGRRGYVAHGRVAACLEDLSRQWNFSWSIQGGRFQAIKDKSSPIDTGFNVHTISYKKRNLFKASPVYGDAFQYQTGMNIEALLDSRVNAGDFVQLESEFYKRWNGKYRVWQVDFTGDTFGQDWKMSIQSMDTAGMYNAQQVPQ